MWNQANRGRAITVAVASVFLLGAPAPLWALEGSDSLSAQSGATEPFDEPAEAAALWDEATAAGALGIYFDWETMEYVVVFSAGSAPSSMRSPVHWGIRTEQRNIEQAQIDAIERDLYDGVGFETRDPYAFMFDPRSGYVAIYGNGPASDFSHFANAYPGLTQFHPAKLSRLNRHNDSAPHLGGAELKNIDMGNYTCSSGFTILRATGIRYMVTAGHCGDNGDRIRGGTLKTWGNVTNKMSFPIYDMELITGSYRGIIYTGPTPNATTQNVKDAENPMVGSTSYCVSGWVTGESCGHHVTSLSATYCDDLGRCTPNVLSYEDGSPVASGDSGAPFFNYKSGGGVIIRGMLIGQDGAAGIYYAEKWSTIAAAYGAAIVTNP